MLERTAGCLESGSLRRFLPGPQRVLKSRRMLHSAFWSHSGREFDLSLWVSLMRSSARDDIDRKSLKRIDSNSGYFLDFLYPSGAMSYSRQFSFWSSDGQEVRRASGAYAKLGQRLYTSLASGERVLQDEDAASFHGQVLLGKGNPTGGKRPAQLRGTSFTRKTLLGLERNDDYEEAWRRFEIAGPTAQLDLIPQLLTYMSSSSRSIDAYRTVELFQRISSSAGLEEHQAALRSYLALGDVSKAVEVKDQIMSRFGSLAGSNILFSHMIEHAQWDLAVKLFTTTQSFRKAQVGKADYNIWTVADTLPNLQDRALELAALVNGGLESQNSNESVDSAMFNMAIMVVQRTLLPKPDLTHFDSAKFFSLLNVLNLWEKDIDPLYERIIERFCENVQHKLALQCYRQYRRVVKHKISRKTLDQLVGAARAQHNTAVMQEILDDWVNFYGRPSKHTYKFCLTEFANRGDSKTVKELLCQYVKEQPAKTPDDIAPLLHVHAKRGELSEVLEVFDNMKAKYGVKPNIKSWNIVINAYGKVGDVEGALQRFDQLLESGMRPDVHTFGTLMGICVSRGDLAAAIEFYQLAESLGVPRSIPMVDCIVLGHIRNDNLQQAEKICEDALHMKLRGSLTRMWNYLLTAYAMRRDLDNANRILRRMTAAGVDYDESTYSALMQALAMVKQPERALKILTKVMPSSGIKATPFHYAIVMGGFLATGETRRVFEVRNQMVRRKIGETASTRLLALKAAAREDTKAIKDGSADTQMKKAEKIFREAYTKGDLQEFTDSKRKGFVHEPLDAAYQSAYFDFLIFVHGQNGLHERVEELYGQYSEGSLEGRHLPPLRILSAVMAANVKAKNYERVQECWELAFSQAKKQGQPIRSEDSQEPKVLPLHELDLSQALSSQITVLAQQNKFQQLSTTIKAVQQAGFKVDSENWNLYIQLLALSYRYQEAFELCEKKLMGGWSGWARLRWQTPGRNRLPIQLRNLKKDPRFLRPKYHTLLFLAKALSELEASATESRNAQVLIQELTKTCPRVIQAIRTMERTDSELEREVMRDGEV